jgi:hypothetical protein
MIFYNRHPGKAGSGGPTEIRAFFIFLDGFPHPIGYNELAIACSLSY